MKTKEKFTDHTISILAYNNPGVISKISGLVTRRGFNIESMTAGKTRDAGISRMTIVVKGDDRGCEQIEKQVKKIIDTVKVSALNPDEKVAREMALIRIKLSDAGRNELFHLINIFKGKIIDTSRAGIIVEITGPPDKIDGFIDLVPKNLLSAVARSGVVGMNKLSKATLE